ncbi:hypothetical protein APSETT445_007456 [Aspergillus pseudonomiae]
MSQRLKESQNTTAFLTTFNEVDMSKVIEFRSQNKEGVLQKHSVKLGFMGPVARASALALREIPAINASIENDDTIVFRDYIDLSVAVATPRGLVTPVLRNMESRSIVEIEQGIAELGKKARDGRLTMDDLIGGTFTISNSGIWGSLFGTPIINIPQTAVLGIYGIQQRPVAIDERIEIRPMMYTALTYDHRLVDGREAVTFLTLVKKYLEDPASMLIPSSQGVKSSPNESPPYGLDLRQIDIPDAIFVDLLDLTTVSRISDRISCVKHGGESCILKVARFKHEIPALQREVAVYSSLTLSGFPHAPKFIGFVYEETKFRVVGFLMESITGKPPGVQNLRDCTETVRLLHAYGIVHGDLNKYNFLITEHGAKVFDFENAVVQGNVDPETAENEIETLAVKLEDESGIGKR